jgi:glycosylphosphatidylinositol phospholipase D
MRKTSFSVWFVIALVLLTCKSLLAAGMATHTEVSERASVAFHSSAHPEYNGFVEKYRDAIQAGCRFPDWGYWTGYQDESELAHWYPFIKAAANRFHQKYKADINSSDPAKAEKAGRYAAFVLGLMCHHAADVAWHAGDGFVGIMGQQNFNGSFDDAHQIADFGGDIACAHEFDMSWIEDKMWVPADDMAEVYHEMGFPDVTSRFIANANKLMFAATEAETNAGYLLFSIPAGKSTFLIDELQGFFMGGLDDMSFWTLLRWEEAIDWMENGVETDNAGFFLANAGAEESFVTEARNKLDTKGINVREAVVAGGVMLSLEKSTAETPEAYIAKKPEQADFMTIGAKAYSYTGKSLARGDLNNDGIDDLIIGAPGFETPGHPDLGAVYVVYGRKDAKTYFASGIDVGNADAVLTGNEDGGRFGWAVTVLDFNLDGYEDLVVSAPSEGAGKRLYNGKVYVFPGSEKGISMEPSVIIIDTAKTSALGFSLSAGDLNNDGNPDLIVGAPFREVAVSGKGKMQQCGSIAIFNSSKNIPRGSMTLDDAWCVLNGEQAYSWFGCHVEVVNKSDGMLIVGAPAYNSGKQNTGRVYGFNLAGLRITKAGTTPQFTLTGESEFEGLGSSFATGDPYGTGKTVLAVSSPAKDLMMLGLFQLIDQPGSVMLASISTLSGDLKISDVKPIAVINGVRAFSRFGAQVAFSDFNADGIDDLWVSETMRAVNAKLESGVVYYFKGGSTMPAGTILSSMARPEMTLREGGKKSQFGSCYTFLDFNADNATDTVISAPRATGENGRLEGTVYVMLSPDGTVQPDDPDDPDNPVEGEGATEIGNPSSESNGSSICFIMTAGL